MLVLPDVCRLPVTEKLMRLGPFVGDPDTGPLPSALCRSPGKTPACTLLIQNGSSVKSAQDFSGAPVTGAVGPGHERFSSFGWPKSKQNF